LFIYLVDSPRTTALQFGVTVTHREIKIHGSTQRYTRELPEVSLRCNCNHSGGDPPLPQLAAYPQPPPHVAIAGRQRLPRLRLV
jgi:hypothetical protein